MSTPIDRMRILMSSLPIKDIALGHKFMNNRDFESLKELVDSALYKVRKGQSLENPKYIDICIEDLENLKSEVDWYYLQLENENIFTYDYENEYESNEEYY